MELGCCQGASGVLPGWSESAAGVPGSSRGVAGMELGCCQDGARVQLGCTQGGARMELAYIQGAAGLPIPML